MSQRAADVETFMAVTDTDRGIAERVLAAHRWDLDRAVEFFMEQGLGGVEALPEAGDEDARGGASLQRPIILDDDDDLELQEVLAASRSTAGAPARRRR